MSATTSNRWPVVVELVRRLRAELSGVQVEVSMPTNEVERTAVWVGDITGTTEPVNMTNTRQPRDDRFTFELWISAVILGDEFGLDAATECERIYAAVEDVLADAPDLDGNVEGLRWIVTQGTNEGPNRRPLEAGWGAYRKVTVSAYSRLA